jgi:hypothetical protein
VDDWSIWAPVVAGLGAAVLTGWVPLGVVLLQRRHTAQDANVAERARAYEEFLSAIMAFVFGMQAAANAATFRSGIQEGLSILLLRRKPIEPFELLDRLFGDVRPLTQAWSKVQAVGSQDAIDATERVMDACMEYMGIVTASDKTRNAVSRVVFGEGWTSEKQSQVENASRAVFAAREALVAVLRQEIGREPILLPITRKQLESERSASKEIESGEQAE